MNDFTVQLAISNADLLELENMIRKADVFRWAYAPLNADSYSARTYIEQTVRYGNNFYVLTDRNIHGRMLSLHGDNPPVTTVPLAQESRVAAAILAFASIAGLRIDPVHAVLEAPLRTIETRQNEVYRLRLLWKLHPQIFADIALGRRGKIATSELESIRKDVEVATIFDGEPPLSWHRDHIAALKITEIVVRSWPRQPKASGMESLLRWMYSDYAFTAPAIAYASLGLGSHPEKGMFKGLAHRDPEAILAGARNAAWDMSFLRIWTARTLKAHTNRELYVLCSADKAVLACAEGMTTLRGAGPTSRELLRARFDRDWAKDGEYLLGVYDSLIASHHTDKSRPALRNMEGSSGSNWEPLAQVLESEIRQLLSSGSQ